MKQEKTPALITGTIATITATLAGAKVMLGWKLTWLQVFLPVIAFFTLLIICALIILYAWGGKKTKENRQNNH